MRRPKAPGNPSSSLFPTDWERGKHHSILFFFFFFSRFTEFLLYPLFSSLLRYVHQGSSGSPFVSYFNHLHFFEVQTIQRLPSESGL